MPKFLEAHKLPKMNQVEIENLNKNYNKQIDWISNHKTSKKSEGLDDFTGEFHQTFEEEIL